MRTRFATFLLLAALALQPALAGGWRHHDERRAPPPQPPPPQYYRQPEPLRRPLQQLLAPLQRPLYPLLSRDQAMQRAQQMNGGGRILAADPAENGYLVRVLKDGEVRSVYVPGR